MSINFLLAIMILIILFMLIHIKNELKDKFNKLRTSLDILENKIDDISEK